MFCKINSICKQTLSKRKINDLLFLQLFSVTPSFSSIKNKSTVVSLRSKSYQETFSNSSSSEKCLTKLSQTFSFMDNQSQYFCHIYYPVNKMLMDIISWSFLCFQNSNNLSYSFRLLFCCKSINFISYIVGGECVMPHFTEIRSQTFVVCNFF